MESKIFIDGDVPDNIKYLSVPYTTDRDEMEECNFFLFVIDNNTDKKPPDEIASLIAQITYLCCKIPRSTFVVINGEGGLISDTIIEVWKSTQANILNLGSEEDNLKVAGEKFYKYSRILDQLNKD